MKSKVVLVDDEQHQLDILTSLLDNFPQLEVVAQFSSSREALIFLQSNKIDILILDVEMPNMSGFDLLAAIPNRDFAVIFSTSYSKYAVHAFRVAAVDFMLKPIGLTELTQAITRFQEQRRAQHDAQLNQLLNNISTREIQDQKIVLSSSGVLNVVKIRDIIRCEVVRNYVVIHDVGGNQYIVSRSMKECEELLEPAGFIRVHQSHLINLEYLKRYVKGEGGEVEMLDGTRVDVSRRLKDNLLSVIMKGKF